MLPLLLVGCRNDASQRDAYIRDLRLHEDRIYELQDYMAEYQQLLREQRCENAKLRERLRRDGTNAPAEPADADDEAASLLDRPSLLENADEDDRELPSIDLGEPTLPEVELGEPLPSNDAEEVSPGEARQTSATLATADIAEAVRSAVFTPPSRPTVPADSCALYAEQIPLESGSSGEQAEVGLMAIVEPLTSDGSAGKFAGEVSLMLVDPIAKEEEWEIARWDYTPEEVEEAWRDTSRRVLDLPLAAPASAPLGRPLELWVRLIPADEQRKILCSTTIELADPVRLIGVPVSGGASSTVPGAVSSGWAAADKLGEPAKAELKRKRAAWQAARMLPPPAVAKAEAAPDSERASASEPRTAIKPAGWSPFR